MFNITIVAHNSTAYWQAVHIRYVVLREPLGLKFSREELMTEDNQWHFVACRENESVVACLVLKSSGVDDIKMRQVAVASSCQKKGIGSKMVAVAEEFAAGLGFNKMNLHARETACLFYEHLGYQRIGLPFQEIGIEHFKMEKVLK